MSRTLPCLAIMVLCLAHASPTEAVLLPNFVVIYADDLGFGDVSCYNVERGKIPTPHIDRLAAEGLWLTDVHSSSGVCTPSRYTLLTGRYHWRTRRLGSVATFPGCCNEAAVKPSFAG